MNKDMLEEMINNTKTRSLDERVFLNERNRLSVIVIFDTFYEGEIKIIELR